jgi:hypothetical protein
VTTFQIVALAILGAVVLWQFVLPNLSSFKLPALPKPDQTLKHLASVIHIRDASSSPEVKTACNALLQALLK